jgi:AraC-like DNA-binding protein
VCEGTRGSSDRWLRRSFVERESHPQCANDVAPVTARGGALRGGNDDVWRAVVFGITRATARDTPLPGARTVSTGVVYRSRREQRLRKNLARLRREAAKLQPSANRLWSVAALFRRAGVIALSSRRHVAPRSTRRHCAAETSMCVRFWHHVRLHGTLLCRAARTVSTGVVVVVVCLKTIVSA